MAAYDATVGRGIDLIGINSSGALRLGPHINQTPQIGGVGIDASPQWCIDGKKADPGPNDLTSIATLTDSAQHIPELALTTPQAAWLLNKYQGNTTDNVNLAALGLLMHSNFENTPAVAHEIAGATQTQQPDVWARALQYVSEARNSAAVGYEGGQVEGDGQRTGNIHGIVVTNGNGVPVAGVPVSLQLSGPAVFDATGTNSWAGTSAAEPITLKWTATGNGDVSYSMQAATSGRRTLTKYGSDGSIQDMITTGNRDLASDPETVTVPGPSWRVIFDFQPTGTSQAASQEINLDGTISDTLTTSVDKSYGDGQWTQVNNQPVPVVYTATAYWAGREKPTTSTTIPAGAEVLGSVDVTATGEGQKLEAKLTTPKRGYVSWVWSVDKAKQGANSQYIHQNWADSYGLEAETTSENFDFRPLGTSNVADAKVIDKGTMLSDTFEAKADPAYRDGEWTRIVAPGASFDEGTFVPVTYRASAYYVSPTELPTTTDSVPASAELIESVTVVANGPGQIKATLSQPTVKAGFVTWVWEVKAEDQPADSAKWIKPGWADQFGLPDETTSVRYPAKIDSTLSIRDTKSGTYLVDDVWVTGLPANHPDFAGGMGFKADTATISHEVLFFPHGLAVTEANRDRAEKIGETVTIPARNGFYPSVGEISWLVKQDANGKNLPGTYVFVSSFAGDDRVQPLTTSVEDVTEQFTITPEPSIHTTLTHENTHVAPNTDKVELVDTVSYQNLKPGKEYVLEGTLMDKATGKPLEDGNGTKIVSTAVFVPETPNGTATVVFTVDGSLFAGKQTVAFEKLTQDGREIAVHTDINDENQTVTFSKLQTTATDKSDGDKTIAPAPNAVITDRVCDVAGTLVPGTEYEITTALMLDNGDALLDASGKPVTVVTKFIPVAANDCASIDITFDVSKLAGKKVVVFETVTQDGKTVSVHHDLKDSEQTVTVGTPPTPPAPPSLIRTGASITLAALAAGALVAGGAWLVRRKRA
ncbi:VaFE repeat-containing surface-anchored protein [Actinotignum timonense]|uniref:VaFE repeat-containing surface-anchored protein n=1 Tax=Actinotignum timonense TaxID=1870995 RepID=UPI002549C2C9|nr:VaFE repeat-containing surface-anchored protein [Actinotignum timonense]MDK6418810.1 VaFE repeat-containing surface-anchored protein [Actinotignum timonense]